jgi:Predicted Peptidoglycan domain
MSTPEQRQQMAAAIVNFEARRDAQGHLKVYELPPDDGGGRYEVAGINEKYNKAVCDALVDLIHQGKFAEAEKRATEFIADDTDIVATWTKVPALESYLRDCAFNRGRKGSARILQRTLGVAEDGIVGQNTLSALAHAEQDAAAFLDKLRAAREDYERDPVGRDESSHFWQELVNRWNKALVVAKGFPLAAPLVA